MNKRIGLQSWTGNKGPGRKPKFYPGEIVRIKAGGVMGVVVDYRQDKRKRGEYRVVRLVYQGQPIYPAGRAVWMKANLLARTNEREHADIVRRNYNANERIPDRGCTCQCCPHVKVALSDIGDQGQLAWEDE